MRGSFTQTLSRPKYSALVPSVNIKRSDNEITIGNPELKPTVSYNFDLSADYYFRSIGLISAGIFYKKIDDFIVDQVSTNYEYQGNTYTRFTQPKNAGNANLVGVELSYQRDFSFIAPALKCVGFYGTYTYTHSRVEDFNFEGRENEKDLSMPGSPEHIANASLYFEKRQLYLRKEVQDYLLRRSQQPAEPAATLLPGHKRPYHAGRILRRESECGSED